MNAQRGMRNLGWRKYLGLWTVALIAVAATVQAVWLMSGVVYGYVDSYADQRKFGILLAPWWRLLVAYCPWP
jgi:hypothetical protein